MEGLESVSLSPAQRRLLDTYDKPFDRIPPAHKAVLLTVTTALAESGIDLSFLALRAITVGAGLDFHPLNLDSFQSQVAEAVRMRLAYVRKPAPRFHRGMCDWGARENRSTWAWHAGGGPAGGFAHIDRFNPDFSLRNLCLHAAEAFGWVQTDYARVARERGFLPSVPA